jgi:hypothetical protein
VNSSEPSVNPTNTAPLRATCRAQTHSLAYIDPSPDTAMLIVIEMFTTPRRAGTGTKRGREMKRESGGAAGSA